MKEIKLGTIGSGPIVHWLMDCVMLTEDVSYEAVYSRSLVKGQTLASEYGVSKVYTDMTEFLADPDVNFVYVASPNSLHYEQAKAALNAGKNVICEKPFATKAVQVRELSGLAKDKGLFLFDATPTAFLPNLKILRRELPKIGPVKLVMGNYSQYSSRYDLVLKGERPNIFSREFGAGCLMDINYYNVYLHVSLFGKPLEAVYYPNLRDDLADTSGVMVLRHDRFVGHLAGAKDTWGVNYFQIEGEKGFIYVEDGPNGLRSIRVVTKQSDETFTDQLNPNRYIYEVNGIRDLVLSEDKQTCYDLLEITADTIEVMEYARKIAGLFFPGD